MLIINEKQGVFLTVFGRKNARGTYLKCVSILSCVIFNGLSGR